MGFEYFYGFMGGETDQYRPWLFRDHTQIFPWVENPGYNLTTAMADEAIAHIKGLNAVAPDQPFFVYYAPRRVTLAASANAGMDQEDQRHAPVRQGLERVA